MVSLLMRAFEIEPTKLVMPFADIDKANMPYFQFNALDVKQEKEAVSIPKASSSQDGLMSKEDKAKLDGVAAQQVYFNSSYAFCSWRCKAGSQSE